jgi:CAP-Gly domain-containing linker protein 1
VAELEAALRESKSTLDKERNEVERLRGGNQESSQLEAKLNSLRKQADDLNEEIQLLEEIKSEHMELQAETSTASKAAETEILRLRAELGKKDERISSLQRECTSLSITGSPILGSRRGSGASVIITEDEQKSMRDQIIGLKMIVNQLTDENHDYSEQNKQLLAEALMLKEAQKALESTVESLMERMELEQDQQGEQQESPSLRRSAKSSNGPLPNNDHVEKELRKQIADVERRKNREIASLNQEVSELEHLVEAKIFREDELESNLKRYRKLLDQARSQGFTLDEAQAKSSKASVASNGSNEDACELCEQKGHDVRYKAADSSLLTLPAVGKLPFDECYASLASQQRRQSKGLLRRLRSFHCSRFLFSG